MTEEYAGLNADEVDVLLETVERFSVSSAGAGLGASTDRAGVGLAVEVCGVPKLAGDPLRTGVVVDADEPPAAGLETLDDSVQLRLALHEAVGGEEVHAGFVAGRIL